MDNELVHFAHDFVVVGLPWNRPACQRWPVQPEEHSIPL